jgi:hypothetical protein
LALLVSVSLRVLLPDPGAASVLGVKAPVTPVGNPVTEKLTAALNPPLPATLSVMLLLDPGITETELADGVT